MNKFDKKNDPTGWNLSVDRVHTYAYLNNLFTSDECKKIIEIANQKGMEKGITVGKSKAMEKGITVEKPDVRLSEICWLFPNNDMVWAYEKITGAVNHLNEQFFQFDIFSFNEGLQFTNYKAPGGHYGKHIDRIFNTAVRKLSLSIQLTDPKEYEGGELILYDSNVEGETMQKEQGTLILFPSYVMHEVKPVTKGERNSLVGWVTGNQFK